MSTADKPRPVEGSVGRAHLTDIISYFDKMADLALHEHDRITPEQLRRQVLLVLKEVERDTRHKAAEIAGGLHAEIMNMQPPNAVMSRRPQD